MGTVKNEKSNSSNIDDHGHEYDERERNICIDYQCDPTTQLNHLYNMHQVSSTPEHLDQLIAIIWQS